LPCILISPYARVVRVFAQPGHWLGPVTWPGWLGLAQSMRAELGPAQKIYAGPGRAQPSPKKDKKIKKSRKK